MNEPRDPGPAVGPVEATLLARLLDDQRRRWRQGERALVEAYREEYPALGSHRGAMLDLIYNEFMLREEAGERPTREEYLMRFPEWAEALAAQFEVDAALNAQLVADMASADAANTDMADADMANQGTLRDPLFALNVARYTPPRPAPPPLVVLPGYEVLEVIGRGGMGVVYKARHIALNRLAAVKMVLAGIHAGPDELERFRHEAETVARLQHPNIVQVYDIGSHEGRPFIALEFVDGSLPRSLAGTPLPPRQAAQWLETLAQAVAHAHQQGIVHRDLKPANVLLSRSGVLKITDFGMAKILASPTSSQTQSGSIIGTPSYMAPEQAEGRTRQIGPAADIYGLGAILYEMLTGRPPFEGTTIQETLELVRQQEPRPPSWIIPRMPRDLETICLRCLQKEPTARYGTAAELAEDLNAFLAGEPIHSRRARIWERLFGWARRHPAETALGATGLLALVALGIGLIWSGSLAIAAVAGLALLIAVGWYTLRLRKAVQALRAQQTLAERSAEQLQLLLDMTRRLMRTTELDDLLRLLVETTVWLTKGELATIYLVDHARRELVSRVTLDANVGEIRLPFGVGIAGTVAATGEAINIPDAYADPRFDPAVDRRTGRKTRSMLTIPVIGQDGRVVGVFQVLNKQGGGAFGIDDIEILTSLAASAAIAIERAVGQTPG
jgi:serine/threonine-protein kinase